MPQSLGRIIVHVVFSTHGRTHCLDDVIRPRVHAYLATVTRDSGSEAYRVGGTDDHVHLAVQLGRTVAVADLVERVKSTSSTWIKTVGEAYGGFAWQRGYGAFSVSASNLDEVLHYISTQDEHHRRLSFQEEYRLFLQRHGVAWDERYVWD